MIKYELRCEICNSKFDSNYNIPKVLICGHTICSKCVDRMKEKNISRCPFDRKLIDFDDTKVANNYYILSLIDGSIKENLNTCEQEVEEVFELNPKPVINNPGWKNTLDGFIKGDILYTIESNGFFYCTDLKTGEWWFLYLNQFWGKIFFQVPSLNKMYMIDQFGNMFQIFNKNYYTQIGKKNAWRNTSHSCIFKDKLYSIETSNKLYETNLENGKWKEIGAKKEKIVEEMNLEANLREDEESFEDVNNSLEEEEFTVHQNNLPGINRTNSLVDTNSSSNYVNNIIANVNANGTNPLINFHIAGINIKIPNIFRSFSETNLSNIKSDIINNITKNEPFYNVKDATMMISSDKDIFVANKKGELFLLNESTGETHFLRNDFSKNIDAYSTNSTHVYFLEKGGNAIYRSYILKDDNLLLPNENELNKFIELGICSQSDPTFNEKEYFKKMENEENNKKKENSSNQLTFNTGKEVPTNTQNSTINLNSKELLKTEKFIDLEETINPVKIIVDETRIIITDKKGELIIYEIKTKQQKKFQCMFMLRNCHLQNTILVGDGDLLILDPIRLSLNKLNILTGSEVIILHSLKFLSTIKYIFSGNSKIYFIDTSGSLFQFLEGEKKIAQIGNNGLCRFTVDFAVHKNFLYTIENSTLYKTNLSDGNFSEVKNDYTSNYKYFFADNVHLVFINSNDEIFLIKPEDKIKLIKRFYHKGISKVSAITYFRNHIVFYNEALSSIEALNLEKEDSDNGINTNTESTLLVEEVKEAETKMIKETNKDNKGFKKVLAENFPEVSLFVNNYDCLACILKDGVIYKLFC